MTQCIRSARVVDGPGEMQIVFSVHHDFCSPDNGQSWWLPSATMFTVEFSNNHPDAECRQTWKNSFRVDVMGALRVPDDELGHGLLLIGRGVPSRSPALGNPEPGFDNRSKWLAIRYDPRRRKGVLWCLPENPFKHPVLSAMLHSRLDALDHSVK